jgi:flagellar protein FlaI
MAVKDTYNFYSENIPITVTIESLKDEFVLVYNVSISKISPNTEIILDKIKEELSSKVRLGISEISDLKKSEFIKSKFQETIDYLLNKYLPNLPDDTKKFLITYLMHKSLGLGKIELLLDDKNLEEIVINNAEEPVWVYHHKHGWLKTNIKLESEDQIKHYSSLIGRKVGRSISLLTPLLDAQLETGDRVNATLNPISVKGNTITLRKFATKPITITDMIINKTISIPAAALIWLGIEFELSALITGGTATGKTSALSALCSFFPPNQRIISVEDTSEIKLPKYLQWIPMLTRLPNVEGKGEITLLDLIVNSLRMRPDRIVVGEIRRQREAETLFEAMHTGHSVYATLHANDVEETINRVTNPPINIPKNLLPAISMIIVMYRNRRTGIRRVFQVAEILKDASANVLLQLDLRQDKILTVNKSLRLMPELEIQTGLTTQEINQNLKEKSLILSWLVKKNLNEVNDIGKVIATYYTNKDAIMQLIKK